MSTKKKKLIAKEAKVEEAKVEKPKVLAQWRCYRLVGPMPYSCSDSTISLEKCYSDLLGQSSWRTEGSWQEALLALGYAIIKREEVFVNLPIPSLTNLHPTNHGCEKSCRIRQVHGC